MHIIVTILEERVKEGIYKRRSSFSAVSFRPKSM